MSTEKTVRATREWTIGSAGVVSFLRWPGSADRDPILFLHPVNTSGEIWSGIAEQLAPERASIAVDLRGHGRSDSASSFLPQDYAGDALAVMDRVGVERVHLVGGSLAGAIAVELTALAPDRVASIAMFGASLCIGAPAGTVEALAGGVRTLGVEGFFVAHGHEILGPSAAPSAAAELVRLASGRAPEQVIRIIVDGFAVADSRPTAHALHHVPPALVAVGSHDPTCPRPMADELAACLGVTPVVLDGIGHLPMIEDLEGTADLVRAFVGRIDPGPGTAREMR